MTTILYILIGLAAGMAIGGLWVSSKYKSVESDAMLTKQALEQERERVGQMAAEIDKATKDRDRLQQEKTELAIADEKKGTELSILRGETDKTSAELKTLRQENKDLHARCESMENELKLLAAQGEKEARMRQEQFAEQLKTVQEQFSNLATRVLDKTSERLKNENTESMEHITRPLKDNLTQLQQAIESSNNTSVKNTTSLSEQLKLMLEQTQKMDKTATNLTNVLRGDNKQTGDWGEMILSELLDAQGLVRGVNYDVQDTIIDERGRTVTNADSGKRMRPDVVLHYPNNEDVVIDAKVSIKAYSDYMEATDELQKKQHLKAHIQSLRGHVRELVSKDYSSYIVKPRRAIDFVIMFVPNDAALQLALTHEPKLWNEAFEQKVFITGTQNLFAILRMIEIAWRQHSQTENQKRVFLMAEELLKRVGDFVRRFDKVGKGIENLSRDYDEAYKKAYTGRQSIVQKANELKELGVKENTNLPIPSAEPELE